MVPCEHDTNKACMPSIAMALRMNADVLAPSTGMQHVYAGVDMTGRLNNRRIDAGP